MRQKVFIRVNAQKDEGLGHWVRCIALASMLESTFDCVFILRSESKKISELTRAQGFNCELLPAGLNLMDEPEFLKLHFFKGDEILVLDSYAFNTEYQKAVKASIGKLVSIDDIHQTHFVSDVVINHSGGIVAADYSCEATTQLCLGLDYLLLRSPFFSKPQRKRLKARAVERVLICMGGEDPHNDTLKVLELCEQGNTNKNYEVVIGSAYRYTQELEAFLSTSRLSINISKDLNAEELADKMYSCSAAICPPSTVALEYLSISGSLFLYQIADNQKYLYKYLIENKLAFPMGEFPNCNISNSEKLKMQQQMIDGDSPRRILSVFKNLKKENNLTFRKAKMDDLQQYFLWANDSDTRKQSFQTSPIPYGQHESWFKIQMNNHNSEMIIMEEDGEAIGQIRFILEERKAIVSYSLDKKVRGKGYAKHLINGGTNYLEELHPTISEVVGYVKIDNQPSIKTFKRIGYKEERIASPFAQLRYIKHLKTAI